MKAADLSDLMVKQLEKKNVELDQKLKRQEQVIKAFQDSSKGAKCVKFDFVDLQKKKKICFLFFDENFM